jgi:hypothetical protein
MRLRFLKTTLAATGAVVCALGLFAPSVIQGPSAAVQAQAGPATYPARTFDGKPDLTGLWQSMSTAYQNLLDHGPEPSPFFQLGAIGATPMGQGVVEGNVIPYQPWAAERQQENFRNRWSRDPELRCYMPGIPRAMYMPYTFQIVHGNNEILMAFPFASSDRVVHMAKRVESVVDTWMGTSNGRWEGDTLVIEASGFNDLTWFDRAGNFHSEQLKLVERLTPLNANALDYEVTVEDAKVFTRQWKIRTILYRRLERNLQIQEFKCAPFVEELVYGYMRRFPTR